MVGQKKKSKKNKHKKGKKGLSDASVDHNNKNFENITQGEEKSLKRNYDSLENDDFNSEVEPKRKKPKKKQIVHEDASGKKNKKSIRQIKREKHAERQAAAEAVAKDQLKSQCLNYLSQWKHDRTNWKFMKAKQVWIFKNKFSPTLIPDTTWPTLLEYFESAQGNIRNMLLADANKIIKQMDDWTESQNIEATNDETEESSTPAVNKPDDIVYNRARSLIQCLGE